MIKKILSIAVLFCTCWVEDTYSQSVTENGMSVSSKSLLSPTGSATGGSLFNMDHYTGTSNINIPIYDYSIDGMSLGVSLGYNTSGIKVDQIASTVGLGWELNAASYIERLPTGLEDELMVFNNANTKLAFGESRCLSCSTYSTNNPGNSYGNNDMFIANLAGRELRFTIDFPGACFSGTQYDSTYISTYPKSEVKIDLLYDNVKIRHLINWWTTNSTSDQPDATKFQFKITDEKGNVFVFDVPEYQTNKKYEFGNNDVATYTAISKWWVSSITTVTGATILYEYAPHSLSYPQYWDEVIIEQYPFEHTFTDTDPDITETRLGLYPVIKKSEAANWTGYLKSLSKITYPNGTVIDFIDNTSISRRDVPDMNILSKIAVSGGYSSTGNNKIEYIMNQVYSYALGTTSNNNLIIALNGNTSSGSSKDYRLRLNSISRAVNNNSAEDYFNFTYDDTRLPSRLSPSQDYYGYYNGQSPTAPANYFNLGSTTPVFSIPYHSFHSDNGNYNYTSSASEFTYTYGTVKTPNFNYLKAEILTKVKNGMGGEIEIFYEPHALTNPSTETFCATEEQSSSNTYDGLRTQKVVYSDGFTSDNNRTTTYTYPNDGLQFYKKFYYWYPTLLFLNDIYQRKWINSYVNPTHFFNGSNHGYTDVYETETGYSNEVLGKTTYHFTNLVRKSEELNIIPNEVDGSYLDVEESRLADDKSSFYNLFYDNTMRQYEMGLPLEIKHYPGNSSQPDKITSYEYETTTIITNPSLAVPQGSKEYPNNISSFSYDYFMSYSNAVHVAKGGNSQEIRMMYNRKRRLKKETTTTYSGGSQLQQILEYEYDDRDNIVNIRWNDSKQDDYVKKFFHVYTNTSPYVQHLRKQSICKVVGTTEEYLSTQEYFPANYTYSLPLLSPISKTIEGSANTIRDDVYTLRDAKKNVTEIEHEGLKYTSQVWDWKTGEKIAAINNARYNQIAYTSFEGMDGTSTSTALQNGNWKFKPSQVVHASAGPMGKAPTGKYVYHLESNVDIGTDLQPNTKYIFSFWSDVPVTVLVNNNNSGVQIYTRRTVNGWTLYDGYIDTTPYGSGSIYLSLFRTTVSSSYGFVDELRLRPIDATMTTYTYEPLLGISSVCDDRNNIIYTEYDTKGRKWRTKDMYGYILSQTTTILKGNNN